MERTMPCTLWVLGSKCKTKWLATMQSCGCDTNFAAKLDLPMPGSPVSQHTDELAELAAGPRGACAAQSTRARRRVATQSPKAANSHDLVPACETAQRRRVVWECVCV